MLCVVAALSENRVIGRNGRLPWHLPDDLKRFKALTMGFPILMGRRTYESIGKPLPGRTSVVLSRNPDFAVEGVTVVKSWKEALAETKDAERVYAIGGAAVFRQALLDAQRLYLTVVHAVLDGDTFFPEVEETQWKVLEDDYHPADEKHGFPFSFRIYGRWDTES